MSYRESIKGERGSFDVAREADFELGRARRPGGQWDRFRLDQVITNLLNNLSVDVDVRNNNVAAQVCAVVAALNTAVGTSLTCDIQQ